MVTIQEERFEQCFDEAAPLIRAHWAEIARNKDKVPLAPNVGRLVQAEEAGALCIVTARDNGVLVGYASDFVASHVSYSETLFGESHIFWLAPEYRARGRIGMRLLMAREDALRARRAVIVHTRSKLAHPAAGRLLVHLGHEPIETVFSKVL